METAIRKIKEWWDVERYHLFGGSMPTKHSGMVKWMFRFMAGCFLAIMIMGMTGCTFLVTTFEIGGAATAAGSTTTAVEVAQALDIAGTAGDAVSVKETGKTLTDHVISFLTEKDCRLWRKLKGDGAYCEVYLPKMDTPNRIKVFQIIEGIRPVNGKMGPKTSQAYWNYEHGVREWDQKLYLKFPHTEEEVKEYQKENGLEPVGNIGPKTIRSLIKYYEEIKHGFIQETERSIRNPDRECGQGHVVWCHQRVVKE